MKQGDWVKFKPDQDIEEYAQILAVSEGRCRLKLLGVDNDTSYWDSMYGLTKMSRKEVEKLLTKMILQTI